MERKEMSLWLHNLGAKTTGSVSAKTNVVIVGENPGDNKIEAAHKKGIPTLSWPMAAYLGILDARGKYRWPHIPKDITAEVIISMATIIEELYVKGVRNDSPRHLRAFIHATNALRALLLLAHGESRGPVGARYGDDSAGVG
jgi:hypothetical protein